MAPRSAAAASGAVGRPRAGAHQIVVASDATGHTAEAVVRAALVQFRGAAVRIHLRSGFEAQRMCAPPCGKPAGSAG